MQSKRKIHQNPYSNEHCYYMKLINPGIDDKETIFSSMGKFRCLENDTNHEYIALKPSDDSFVDL